MTDGEDPEVLFERYWEVRLKCDPSQAAFKTIAAHAFYAAWILYGKELAQLLKRFKK